MTKSVFLGLPAHGLLVLSLLGLAGCYAKVEVADSSADKAIAIDWVEPACAEIGETGYVEGNGFGAKNVTIVVDGIEAEVIKATGHDASFVVPEELTPGPIEVVVTNPGGRIATINWVVCGFDCSAIDCDDGNECTTDSCDPVVEECLYTPVGDGTACDFGGEIGTCVSGLCEISFPCTEQGILDAIAAGGGPHTFDCNGPTVVTTQAEIVIDNDVILDGEGDLTVDGDLKHRVFSVPAGITTELRGLEVTRGNTTQRGGGIDSAGALTLANSVVSGNTCVDCQGGGIFQGSGQLTLLNSEISDNTARQGGGIQNASLGTLTVTSSTISGNEAENLGGGLANRGTAAFTDSTISGNNAAQGGGIDNSSFGTLTVTSSTISGNEAVNIGGGLVNRGELILINTTVSGNNAADTGGIRNGDLGTLTVTGSTISGNEAVNIGGGLVNTGTATLANSTVSGNTAMSGGGITSYGTLMITGSTISGNEAANSGGGIININTGTATLANSTVSGNRAMQSGGIENSGTLTVTGSTISGNEAVNSGGGILNFTEGTLAIADSTISENTAGTNGDAIYSGDGAGVTIANSLLQGDCRAPTPWVSNGHNIESPGNTCGFDQPSDQVGVSADDLSLGPLADNGGPTETHALLPGSVAIDWIPLAACVDAVGEPLTEDQRGQPRPGGTMCDVGAFEVQP